MYKQNITTPVVPNPGYRTSASTRNRSNLKSVRAPRLPLLHRDPLYTQLNQLGLVTPQFDAQYRLSRRQATGNLLGQLVFIQNLYQGSRLDFGEGSEELQVQAMELNTHLIRTAGFGAYSNAAKINILYQLRKVLEKMFETHFGAAKRRWSGS